MTHEKKNRASRVQRGKPPVEDKKKAVEEMSKHRAQYVCHPFLNARRAPDLEKRPEDQLQKTLLLIGNGTGHDFSHYKLSAVNSERQEKIDELSKAYDDLNNLLATTEVATLILDGDLHVSAANPAFYRCFPANPKDAVIDKSWQSHER